MNRQVTTGMGCELMKLLRDNRLSRQQIAELLGWSISATEKWTREYEAHGLLLAERAPVIQTGSTGGKVPMLYTLAPAWRGNGAAA